MGKTRVVRMGVAFALIVALGASGCGTSGGGDGDPPAPTPITVNGTVMLRRYQGAVDRPAIGTRVRIVGHPDVLTDTAGEFEVTNVRPPYTVLIFDDPDDGAVVYVGLTRPDPVMTGPYPAPGFISSATVAGTLSGGVGWPAAGTVRTYVGIGSEDRGSLNHLPASGADGTWSGTLRWPSAGTIPVSLAALQWNLDGSGTPTGYTGAGTATGNVTASDAHTIDFPMVAVANDTISGTIGIPAGYGVASVQLLVAFDSGPRISVEHGSVGPGPFTVPVPVIPDTTLRLNVLTGPASGGLIAGQLIVQPGATGVSIQLPPITEVLAPADGTTLDPTTTPFRVVDRPNRVHYALYLPDLPFNPYFVFVTPGGSWTLPDLSAEGIPMPPGATYDWTVAAFGPVTMDEFCSGKPIESRTSFFSSAASARTFVVAP